MQEKLKGYMLLADGSIHSETEEPQEGFFVRGYILDDKFFPEGHIEGKGSLGTSGYPGRMELLKGTFCGMQTGRPPFPPYIEGYMTSEGFQPSSRQIVY